MLKYTRKEDVLFSADSTKNLQDYCVGQIY